MTVQRVYFEPAGRIHSAHRELLQYPPPGYEFVTGGRAGDRLAAVPTGSERIIHNLPVVASKLLPVPLVKAWPVSMFSKPPTRPSPTHRLRYARPSTPEEGVIGSKN